MVHKIAEYRKNIFFTGSAGTGKTVVLKYAIQLLRQKQGYEGKVAVTASTGRAAFAIGGSTVHSFAGIGLGTDSIATLTGKINRSSRLQDRWLSTKVLFVDEVSMLSGDLLDKLEQIARKVRNNQSPFGGIQLILTGDFLQLPPVSSGNIEVPRRCSKPNVGADVLASV